MDIQSESKVFWPMVLLVPEPTLEDLHRPLVVLPIGGSCGGRHFLARFCSKVTFPLLDLHRSLPIVIDDAVLSLRTPEMQHLLHDLGHRVGFGADRAGTRRAS